MGDGTTYRKSLSIPKASLLAVICFLIGFVTRGNLGDLSSSKMILPTTQKDVDGEDPSPGALRNAQVIEIDDDDDNVHKDDDLGEKGVKNLAGGVTEEEM